ncbi:Lipin/Ned1/Smp2-domain-containing protein [Dichotomocladium elegans]|nr:Lipin/Ned1/Smp2-domain-containing protein [Dichotomocladium elegans]
MIIQEQVDKVVTKLDSLPTELTDEERKQELVDSLEDITIADSSSMPTLPAESQAKNDIYPMDDGSSLLERCVPETITSTTLTKETFIVRPADGDIYSKYMDVTHTPVDTRADIDQDESVPTEPTSPRHGDAESIFLDMAGYKTGGGGKNRSVPDTPTREREIKSQGTEDAVPKEEIESENEEVVPAAPAPVKDDSSTKKGNITIKPGETYRIEISLCGLMALGSDEEANNEIFNKEQLTYDNFVHNPNILNDRRLVFRSRGHYYAASPSGPLFTSFLLFQKPVDEQKLPEGVDEEQGNSAANSSDTYSFGRGWRQWLSRSSVDASNAPLGIQGTTVDDDSDAKATTKNETTTYTTTTKTTSVGWAPDHVHPDEEPFFGPRKNYAKTLRLTSEQLKTLNLKKGMNEISFSVTSAYQGTACCTSKVFFWDYDVSIVISDIDGTITKSDALGHVFAMLGKDWTHVGIAKLYTDIEKNGYHFMYLTSRAIGQADTTRDYLKKIVQGEHQLPDGPVIMSPDRLFTSLHREVIMRKPEVFKMACLRDVLRLFDGRNPFYAGFGNRITDAISYRSVSVPASRIFTIDSNGELKLELLQGFKSSYFHLNDLVDQIFPPIKKTVSEEFTDYNFWKAPLPEIDLPPELQDPPAPTSPKPKPIVADPSSTLPARSVVEAPRRRQRGILRSFTSRSSTSTTSSLKINSSTSTPTSSVIRDDVDSRSIEEPSSPLESVSSYEDHPATPDDSASSISTITTSSESSRGIVKKMFGGVFSRRSKQALPPPPASASAAAAIATAPLTSLDKDEDLTGYEEADDVSFDATLDAITDEIDMDSIPFI